MLEPELSCACNEIKRDHLSGTCEVLETILACYSYYLRVLLLPAYYPCVYHVPQLMPECTVHSCIKHEVFSLACR